MKEFNYKEWLESLNDDERSMVEFLEYAKLSVEENPHYEEHPSEEYEDEDWVIHPFILRDDEITFDPVYITSAQNVFEAHDSIVNELLDGLYEDITKEESGLYPERIYNGEELLYPTEAPFYAYVYDNPGHFPTIEKFIQSHAWELKICKLIAEGYKNVDLNKIVYGGDNK